MISHLKEGYHWLTDAVTQREVGGPAGPSTEGYRTLRAQALDALGCVAMFQCDLDAAQRWLEESLALFRDLGNREGIAEVLGNSGMLFLMRGDFGVAGPLLDESLTVFRELGRTSGIWLRLFFLGVSAGVELDLAHFW